MLAALAGGCADIVVENNDSIQARVLAAWVRENYPDKAGTADQNGIYILERDASSGRQVTDSVYVFISYTARYLNGDIKDTNREDVSKQLGEYDPTTYYSHDIWYVNPTTLTPGIYNVLKTMKKGERVVAALPPAMLESTTVNYYSLYYYSTAGDENNDNIIYEIEVLDIVDDIYKYQISQLEAFRDEHFPGLDTLANGIYFKLISGKGYSDTLSSGTTFNTRYVGKMLDGFVFDTNVSDTARFYRCYDSSKDYKALSVKWYKDDQELYDNNSVVKGYAKAIQRMQKGDHAIVFFASAYGYGDSGSSTIPSYSPLVFDITVEQ